MMLFHVLCSALRRFHRRGRLKDNRAIFQIPSKSKCSNSYGNWLKYVLIYGQSINERENPVNFLVCGVQKVKHQQFYRNLQMNEMAFNGKRYIFSCTLKYIPFSMKHFTSMHSSRSQD